MRECMAHAGLIRYYLIGYVYLAHPKRCAFAVPLTLELRTCVQRYVGIK